MRMAHKLKSFGAFLHKHRLAATVFVVAASFIFARFAFAVDIATIYTLFPSMLMTALGLIYNVLAWAIGQLIVLLIGMVLIPILGYNGFADANIISIGWPLIRDVMNMGVILILLWIAIRTMLGIGGGAAGAQQSLVRLFAGVVALNFSRTICIIIIDASQVVMFTFVNALRDIAAGNFAALFNLNAFLEVTVDGFSDAFSSGGVELGLESFGYLGSAYATVMLLAAVLGVMVLLAGVFVYRIVLLWILVILSPIALFFKAAGPLIPGGGGGISQWSKMFTGAVTLGPILAFFLWLALAAAGGGGLATTEGFPSTGTDDITGLLNDVFEVDEIMSLLLGLVLLVIGLQVATSAASSMGGVADKAFGQNGYAMKWVKGAVTLPATLPARGAYMAGREAIRQVDRDAEKRGVRAPSVELARQMQDIGTSMRDLPFLARAGGWVAGQGSDLEAAATASSLQARKKATDTIAKAGDRELFKSLAVYDDPAKLSSLLPSERNKILAAGNYSLTKEGRKRILKEGEAEFMRQGHAKDEAKRLAKEQLQQRQRAHVRLAKDNPEEVFGGDSKAKEAFEESLIRNSNLLSVEQIQEAFEGKEASEIRKELSGATDALGDPRVQRELDKIMGERKWNAVTNEYEQQSLLEELRNGSWGTREMREASHSNKAQYGATPSSVINMAEGANAAAKKDHADNLHAEQIAGAVQGEYLQPRDLRADHLQDATGAIDPDLVAKHARAFALAGASLGNVDATLRPYISGELEVMARQLSANATTQRTTLASMPRTTDAEVKAYKEQETKVKDIDKQLRQTQKALFAIGHTPAGGSSPTEHIGVQVSGTIQQEYKQTVREVIVQQPDQIVQFGRQVAQGVRNNGNDVTQSISETANKQLFEKFKQLSADAASRGDVATQRRLQTSLDTVINALHAEIRKVANASPSGKAPNTMLRKLDDAQATRRYLA